MKLHPSTFQYLKPTEFQMSQMSTVRAAVAEFERIVYMAVPDGPDLTYIQRKIREIGMWVNVSITREADGAPRL